MTRQWEGMKILLSNKPVRFAACFLIVLSAVFCVFAQKQQQDKQLTVFEKSIDEGKLSEIEKELFNYVVANPQDAAGFSLLAKLRLKQDRLNEAKALSQKALSINPNFVPAKINLAVTFFQIGDAGDAMAALSGISETDVTDNNIRLNLAWAYVLLGDCANAQSTINKLPLKAKNSDALSLRAKCYLETGNKKNVVSLIPLAKMSIRQNLVSALSFAEVISKSAMHKEAAEVLRLVVATSPKNTKALLLLTRSEIYLKNYAGARVHLAWAEKIQPESAELLFAKAFLESEQGNNTQALNLLEKSLALNPDNQETLILFVFVAIRASQSGKAVRAAERLLNSQPENPDYLYLHGAASLQNNSLAAAERSLTKFMEMRPQDSRGCVALGLVYAAQPEKLDIARWQMENCLKINPGNFEATYQLGLSYKTQGETAKAIGYLEDTVKLSPDYASALRDLGALYLQSGAEAKARPVLEKAVALNPNDADTHFQLSRLYNLIGESLLAKKHLEIFQKLRNPNKPGM